MDLRISQSGWRQAGNYFKGVARRARNLHPLRDRARQRWSEAERRQFANNNWTPRTAATLLRYTWPITHRGRREIGTAVSQGTGHFSGVLAQALSTEGSPGLRDEVFLAAGSLETNFGVDPNGPLAHANWLHEGVGGQEPRDVFVWDQQAQDDLAEDAQEHMWMGLR